MAEQSEATARNNKRKHKLCEHGRRKSECKFCGGSEVCQHMRRRRSCKDCHGSQFCIHGKIRQVCKPCGGKRVCKSDGCEIGIDSKKYGGYCIGCWTKINPEEAFKTSAGARAHNNRIKEIAVASYVKGWTQAKKQDGNWKDKAGNDLPDWVLNKTVQGGNSKKRPDLLLFPLPSSPEGPSDALPAGEARQGGHDVQGRLMPSRQGKQDRAIIVEIDEHGHKAYDAEKDRERTATIKADLGNVPIVFIRFNPDSYEKTESDGSKKRVHSCWSKDKQGLVYIKREEDWNNRLIALLGVIQKYIECPPNALPAGKSQVVEEYMFF